MNMKKVLAVSLVAIMIAILSFNTLAWFVDEDNATNDFTVNGAGQDDPDKIFSVEVKENVDGEDEPVDEMTFEDVLPGADYKKEAFVTNTGSNDQYIRVTLTVSDWDLVKDIISINMDDAFASNWVIDTANVSIDADGNLSASGAAVDTNGNLVVIIYLDKILTPAEKVDLMDYVSISEQATQDDFAAAGFADGFIIDVHADAVQTQNILDTYGPSEWENARDSFNAL